MTTGSNNGCPFTPRCGYVDARKDYLFHFHNQNGRPADDDPGKNLPTESRTASANLQDPLYFWQLYSLIGANPIVDLVTDFYERVFSDVDHPWFRNVFVEVAPLHHHIQVQVAYWVDAFGGGKCYHGGDYRLTMHHTHNAGPIMNAQGAQRWMHHMRGALMAIRKKRVFRRDPRILPCIVDFLEVKMRSYASHHDWTFDETDFAGLKEPSKDPKVD